MTSPPAQASGSDLTTRFAAGVLMIGVACGAIYLGGWPFRLLVALGAAAMLFEWGEMHRVRRLWTYAAPVLLAGALLAVSEWLFPVGTWDEYEGIGWGVGIESFEPLWTGVAILAGLALLAALASRRGTMFGGFLYVAIPAFALNMLEWASFELVFWLMLVTWATDIFAYFAGRSVGGPKLVPRISPNKTWAGLAGGMVGAALVGALAAHAFDLGPPFLYVGAAMGLIAQLGDLFESWVKRRRGVKDSGSILPGHGGVLDRLDGLLPVIVATLLLLMATLATA